GTVRLTVPGERRTRPADAADEPEQTHPAVAAAAALGPAAGGRAAASDLSGDPGDAAGGAAGRLRPAVAAAADHGCLRAAHPPDRDGTRPAVALCARPAVRVRRRVHVRGRLASRRTTG